MHVCASMCACALILLHWAGGGDGKSGRNTLIRADKTRENIGPKCSIAVLPGVSVLTSG